MNQLLRQQAARLAAILVLFVAYTLARTPHLAASDRSKLAGQFHFMTSLLPGGPDTEERTIRSVHPDLAHIASWISSVGAGVALNDLDGDGLSNDLCHVEVRTDQVLISPAPDTGDRYQPFALTQPDDLYSRTTMAPMGCLPNDMNEDGRVDLLVYYWGRTPIAYLRTGETRLTANSFIAQPVVPEDERWYTNAATFADVDGDSHADLIIGNYFQDGSHILDAHATDHQQMQHSMSNAFNGGKNRILLWQAAEQDAVRFYDAPGLDEIVAHGWTLAIGAADLDGDLRPEIYFANDFGPDRLLHNRSTPGQLAFALLEGERRFTTPNSKVLGQDGFKGMGVDFADLNQDGWLDIFVSDIATEYALQESHLLFLSTGEIERMNAGIAPYVENSENLGLARSGWAWDAKLADFNNDSVVEALQATGFVKGKYDRWPELHELAMSNDELLTNPNIWPDLQDADLSGNQPNPFFVRAADGRYYDLAAEVGLGVPQVTRGIAIADVDGDGDLDFAVANQWDDSRFYRNDCLHCGAFLGIHLLLPIVNGASNQQTPTLGRAAIGAAVTVELSNGQQLIGQVDGGNGHSGKRSPDLYFGLGQITADAPLRVQMRWRDEQGKPQQKTLTLTPGWHTVVLGKG